MTVVVIAHTVVDPGTMMIHLQDALLADPAMVGSRWFETLAVLAVPGQRSLLSLLGYYRGSGGGGCIGSVLES